MGKENDTAVEPEAAEALTGVTMDDILKVVTEDILPEAGMGEAPEKEKEPEMVDNPVADAETEEPETEEPEADSTEEEADEGSEEDPKAEDQPEESYTIKKLGKRIDKLVSKRNEQAETIKELQRKVEESSQKQAEPSSEVNDFVRKVDAVKDPRELEVLESQGNDMIEWIRDSLTEYQSDPEAVEADVKQRFGFVPEDGNGDADILGSLKRLRTFVREAQKKIPETRQRLSEKKHWDAEAVKLYPWLNDPESEVNAYANKVLEQYGDIKLSQIPEVKLFLGRYLLGYSTEQSRATKGKAPKAKRPEPTSQPGAPAGRKVRPSKSGNADRAAQKIFKGGGLNALTELVEAAIQK